MSNKIIMRILTSRIAMHFIRIMLIEALESLKKKDLLPDSKNDEKIINLLIRELEKR